MAAKSESSRTVRIGVRVLLTQVATVLCVLATPAVNPVLADDAPWMAMVTTPEDRAMLEGLLDPDDENRKQAVRQWHKDRWVAKGRIDSGDDRTTRIFRALGKALEVGPVQTQVAACLSIAQAAEGWGPLQRVLEPAIDHEHARVRAAAMRGLLHRRFRRGWSDVKDLMPRVVVRILDKDPGVRRAAIELAGARLHARSWPQDLDEVRNKHGDVRGNAVRSLFASVQASDPGVRAAALTGLAQIAPGRQSVFATLTRGLDDAAPAVRASAADALRFVARESGIRAEAQPWILRLRALLADEGFEVRWAAAQTLWFLTEDSAGIVPVCREALRRLEGRDLVGPCRLICRIGPDAVFAAPDLVPALGKVPRSRHSTSGSEPLRALYSIGANLADVREAVRSRLRDPEPNERIATLYGLRAVHASSDELVGLIDAHLTTEADPRARNAAIGILVSRAPAHGRTHEWVKAALQGESIAAVGHAGAMAGHAASFVPTVTARLDKELGKGPGVRLPGPSAARRIFGALGAIGTTEAIEALIKRIEHPGAMAALASAGEAASGAVDAVLGQYGSNPRAAAQVLRAICSAATKPKLPALQARLDAAGGATLIDLTEAIRKSGGDAEPCVEALLRYLKTLEVEKSAAAATALGRWGKDAARALPDLRRIRDDSWFEDGRAGVFAAVAAYRIGGEDELEAAANYAVELLHGPASADLALLDAMRHLGPAVAPAVQRLVEIAMSWRTDDLGRRTRERTRLALRVLGAMGPAAQSALPAIRSLGRNVLFTKDADAAIARIEAKSNAKK